MGKSIALAAAVVAVALVSAVAVRAAEERVMTRATTRAEAEAIHYARLWTVASEQHVQRNGVTGNAEKWRCCRPCAQNTVPFLHEAFEGDKNDAPAMKAAPPEPPAKDDAEKKDAFVEVDAASASASASADASHGRGGGTGSRAEAATRSVLSHEQKREFLEAQQRKHRAQQDALHGVVTDATGYSCCNQCPDLMYPFPGTWNRPSPYSYVPRRFRFAGKNKNPGGAVLAEVDATAQQSLLDRARAASKAASGAAVEAEAESEAEAEAESESESEADTDADAGSDFEMPTDSASEGISKYVWSNPHDLPIYRYWESMRKAAAARDKAMRFGWYDKKPQPPGAAPIWHPPPPPHDDIYRIPRSPNLHDGFDLHTPPFLPPCCDYCMSTYFPQIINDELQLPKHDPYSMAPVSFAETDSAAAAGARAGGNSDAVSSAEAYAATLASAKSDPKKCCHKCVRKDIEDTDWQIYALPPKPKKSINPLQRKRW